MWWGGDTWCISESASIIAYKDVVIVLAPSVIGRMGDSTYNAFDWGVPRFSTHAGMMMPAAFDAGIWFVAVTLRMPILLTAVALWNANVCARGFKEYNLVLNGGD